MSTDDLTFSIESSTIYDPVTLTGSLITISVTNFGDEDLTDLGLYIVPASSLGDLDYPADEPPATDYEDLLSMGQRTVLGLETQGGLYLDIPTNDGNWTGYVTRTQGSMLSNKIEFVDIGAGDTVTFQIKFETPGTEEGRRFYINLVLA